jgi:hypothetical protein
LQEVLVNTTPHYNPNDPGQDQYGQGPFGPNNAGRGSYGWRWKPVDIAVIVVAFVAFWPLGLAVLVWKLWNDRQPNPQDLEHLIRGGLNRLQAGFDSMMASFSQNASTSSAPAATGNETFDAHIREEWARIEAERLKLEDEVAAFRAFLAREQSGGRDVYERFRSTRAQGQA